MTDENNAQTGVSPELVEQLRARWQERQEQNEFNRGTGETLQILAATPRGPLVDEDDTVAADIGPAETPEEAKSGFVREVGRAAWGAVVDGVTESFIATVQFANWVLPIDTITGRDHTASFNEFADDMRRVRREGGIGGLRAPENESMGGQMARSIGQFLVPFAALGRTYRASTEALGLAQASTRAQAYSLGAMADMLAFDPDEGNLSAFAKEMGIENIVTDFLATNPDDSNAENRMRMAMEGALLGRLLEAGINAPRALRDIGDGITAYRRNRALREYNDVEPAPKRAVVSEEPPVPARTDAEPPRADAEQPRTDLPDPAAREAPAQPPQRVSLRDRFRMTTDEASRLRNALEEGRTEDAAELLNYNARTLLDELDANDGQNIVNVMATFEEHIGRLIGNATGGRQAIAETKRLAEDVGFSAEQVHNLFRDTSTGGGMAARVMASRATMDASSRRLRRLAEAAKSGNRSDEVALLRHMELHGAIMSAVKGSQTDIARALNAMKYVKAISDEAFNEFDNAVRMLGYRKGLSPAIDQVLNARDVGELNTLVNAASGKKAWDMISEVAINGLLSAVKTPVVLNLAGNVMQYALLPVDRFVRGLIAAGRTGFRDRTELIAAQHRLMGQIGTFGDAVNLMVEAFRREAPQSDPRTKLETHVRRAIFRSTTRAQGGQEVQREGLDLALSNIVNFTGQAIRLPMRVTFSLDEFFKKSLGEGELRAGAYLEAMTEARGAGREGDEVFIRKAMERYIANPTSAMRSRAIEEARYGTWQESARTRTGGDMEKLVNSHPLIKLTLAPFFRTPMNILRQSMVDRGPLGVFSKQMWGAVNATVRGNPTQEQADMAARFFVGMGIYTTGMLAVMGGGPDKPFEIVGNIDRFSSERMSKVRPYSIRIGSTWIEYKKGDPLGTPLGMMADIHHHLAHEANPHDPDAPETANLLTTAFLASIQNNVLDKTFMTSFKTILDSIQIAAEGGAGAQERAVARFLGDQARKVVPFSSFLRSLNVSGLPGNLLEGDDVQREAFTVAERVLSGIPGQSRNLPPRRDMLGREVTIDRSELFWINPFATSTESDDPLDRELANLAFHWQPPPKNLDGIPLNAEQYSEYMRLIGQERKPNGRTGEDEMRRVINMGRYQSATDPMRVAMLQDVYSKQRQWAKEMLYRQYDDLNAQRLQRRNFDAYQLTGRESYLERTR